VIEEGGRSERGEPRRVIGGETRQEVNLEQRGSKRGGCRAMIRGRDETRSEEMGLEG
jgi:hypothetical protein